jgi:hypothetical protein
MAAMSSDNLPESYFLFAGSFFTSSGWVDTVLYALTRRTLLFNELTRGNHSSGAKAGQSSKLPRQSSTDSILGHSGFEAAFGGSSGIVLDRTVKIELDDVESQNSSMQEGKSYFVSAKAMPK